MGLHRAGFEVVGVDIEPQKNYPFEFHQADAMTYPLEGFDAYWASPPCQGYSIMRNLPWLRDRVYPMLIPFAREMLLATGKPYIIENVGGARFRAALPEGLQGGWLCGTMFGLPIFFHRLFESNILWLAPGHAKHRGVIRSGHQLRERVRVPIWKNGFRSVDLESVILDGHPSKKNVERVAAAKSIDWMEAKELSQAIPPAYSEYIGRQLMKVLVDQPQSLCLDDRRRHTRDVQPLTDP